MNEAVREIFQAIAGVFFFGVYLFLFCFLLVAVWTMVKGVVFEILNFFRGEENSSPARPKKTSPPVLEREKQEKVKNATARPDVIDAIEEECAKRGAVLEVDEAFYRRFLDLTERQMSALIEKVIYSQSDEINRMCLARPRKYTEEDVFRFILNIIRGLSMGLAVFNEEGDVVFVKRKGAEPSLEMENLLTEKVESFQPLIKGVFLKVLQEQAEIKKGVLNSTEGQR